MQHCTPKRQGIWFFLRRSNTHSRRLQMMDTVPTSNLLSFISSQIPSNWCAKIQWLNFAFIKPSYCPLYSAGREKLIHSHAIASNPPHPLLIPATTAMSDCPELLLEHTKLHFTVSKPLILCPPTTLFNVYIYLEVILLYQCNFYIWKHWGE